MGRGVGHSKWQDQWFFLPSNSSLNTSNQAASKSNSYSIWRQPHFLSDVLKCFLESSLKKTWHDRSWTMQTFKRNPKYIDPVVPKTGWLLSTFWRSTRDFHTLRNDDSSSFIKARLGCAPLAGSQTNTYVIIWNPCKAGKGDKDNMHLLFCAPMQEESSHTEATVISGPLPWPWKCDLSLWL